MRKQSKRPLFHHGIADLEALFAAESGDSHILKQLAEEMRRRLDQESALFAALSVAPRNWTANRVGTIHTVQGREAEAVILVLGAPMTAQQCARAWAARSPNILNVAVSRAKQTLYVIGSHAAWAGTGHARELGHPAVMPKVTQ